MITELDILAYAGIYRTSLSAAAHELEHGLAPEDRVPTAVLIKAIDLRRERGTGTRAGDYYDDCLEAALNCSYVWDKTWTPTDAA